ncbi:tRNA nucleotidyltransferase-like protein [Collimonas sp. PA-H2]|uniref:CBASS oligonucleotide cyclase n=1 Tax=Collimonas sp. PA-H2 TaxID=1881062 RepID=UPI000BF5F787|nr:CBASS oligonucleotide cyclase [Collimonas sp. PA-H2]PFH12391.1 tRNA nucleotidyltransferase-like protein [Collimonas sp. PA-H2]
MGLTNTELSYYDGNVLRLPAEKRKEYHQQVDRLIDELRKHVTEKSALKITKVVKAGSFAKYTILRKTTDDPVDVDVVFYISGKDANQETLDSLSEMIHSLLINIYPSKSVEDFEIQKKAATVTFIGSGLSVDVVPIVQDPSRENHGWQYDLSTGVKSSTCAPCQIKFVRDRKEDDAHFRTLVRLAKRWRNHAQPPGLKSFHIELIMAYLLDRDGAQESIEKRFRDFLLYIAQSGLKERIDFRENHGKTATAFTTPVVIVDPANSENNVASRISEDEREEIVKIADESWETAIHASEEGDVSVWKEIFGPRFKIKDAE